MEVKAWMASRKTFLCHVNLRFYCEIMKSFAPGKFEPKKLVPEELE